MGLMEPVKVIRWDKETASYYGKPLKMYHKYINPTFIIRKQVIALFARNGLVGQGVKLNFHNYKKLIPKQIFHNMEEKCK